MNHAKAREMQEEADQVERVNRAAERYVSTLRRIESNADALSGEECGDLARLALDSVRAEDEALTWSREEMEGALVQLLLSYAKGDEARPGGCGHVEWEDVDLAVQMAKDALPGEYERILQQLDEEEDEEEEPRF